MCVAAASASPGWVSPADPLSESVDTTCQSLVTSHLLVPDGGLPSTSVSFASTPGAETVSVVSAAVL